MAVQAGDSQEDPLIGTQIGNYRIERLVGSGGMGRVYQAVQDAIGAKVAIKVIAQRVVDEELQARFFAEARAVNLIRHERIVNIIDLQSLPDGRPCIVMEYLEGAPLDKIIKSFGKLPLGMLTRLGVEILDALEAAHEQSIIHRDLKPANVVVTPEGHAKLVDFGVAKLLDDPTTAQTMAGAVIGTTPYMSPEQAEGSELDGRSDLFALGVLLYEAATGARPFKGDNVILIRAQHELGAQPPEVLRADIPPELSAVIMQSIQFDREQRFSNAAAMQRALGQVLAVLPPAEFVEIDMEALRLRTPSASAPRAEPEPRDGSTKATVRERPARTGEATGNTDPEPSERPEPSRATEPDSAAPSAAPTTSPDAARADGARRVSKRGLLLAGLAALAVGLAALLILRSSDGEHRTVPDPAVASSAVDAARARDAAAAGAAPDGAQVVTPDVSNPKKDGVVGPRPAQHLTLEGQLEQARALARERLPDAELTSMEAHRVEMDGQASGLLTYRFASQSARDAMDTRCRVVVRYDHKDLTVDSAPVERISMCPKANIEPRCQSSLVMATFAQQTGAAKVEAQGQATLRYGARGWTVWTKATATWDMPVERCR